MASPPDLVLVALGAITAGFLLQVAGDAFYATRFRFYMTTVGLVAFATGALLVCPLHFALLMILFSAPLPLLMGIVFYLIEALQAFQRKSGALLASSTGKLAFLARRTVSGARKARSHIETEAAMRKADMAAAELLRKESAEGVAARRRQKVRTREPRSRNGGARIAEASPTTVCSAAPSGAPLVEVLRLRDSHNKALPPFQPPFQPPLDRSEHGSGRKLPMPPRPLPEQPPSLPSSATPSPSSSPSSSPEVQRAFSKAQSLPDAGCDAWREAVSKAASPLVSSHTSPLAIPVDALVPAQCPAVGMANDCPADDDDDDNICVCCLDAFRTHAAVPCGHRSFCEGCMQTAQQRSLPCPVCRRDVQLWLRVWG